MVCAAVFGMHVVCASTRVWSLPEGLFPSQQEAEYSFLGFILTNKQTNKQKPTCAVHVPDRSLARGGGSEQRVWSVVFQKGTESNQDCCQEKES